MGKRTLVSVLILSIGILGHLSGQMTGSQLVEKSIQYHDPSGETKASGATRVTTVDLDEKKSFAKIKSKHSAGQTVVMTKNKGKHTFTLNGKEEVSKTEIKEHRLTAERLEKMKNYYRYLWMSPIILHDNGTIIHDEVKPADFFGTASLEVKVTYDPSVGKDIWYFYFHPETFAMVGYRFYHDEKANDGEYILLSGQVQKDGVRIPKLRKWYMHKDDRYLGKDELEDVTIR